MSYLVWLIQFTMGTGRQKHITPVWLIQFTMGTGRQKHITPVWLIVYNGNRSAETHHTCSCLSVCLSVRPMLSWSQAHHAHVQDPTWPDTTVSVRRILASAWCQPRLWSPVWCHGSKLIWVIGRLLLLVDKFSRRCQPRHTWMTTDVLGNCWKQICSIKTAVLTEFLVVRHCVLIPYLL